MTQPRILTTCREVFEYVTAARAAGRRVGLVPTMGALHAGHLSLVEASQAACDTTVVTIFVNPTQFGASEDLAKYPRPFDADIAALASHVECVFAPSNDEMYPAGFSTRVEPPQVASPLEGVYRPGHFRGVATVVLKLFNVAPADVAFFGQKDYQQSLVIRRMVADLNVPIDVRVCPIVREPDGLALSSRNVYLTADERQRALSLSRSLTQADELVRQGERDVTVIERRMLSVLEAGGVTSVDYAAVVDADSLDSLSRLDRAAVALIAARVGATRLIDNCRLG